MISNNEYSKTNRFLGNLLCRLFDLQISKFTNYFFRFMIGMIAIFELLYILFMALNQSLNNEFFSNTVPGIFMAQYSSSYLYQWLVASAVPILLITPFILIIVYSFLRVSSRGNDFTYHYSALEYSEDQVLKRLINNLKSEYYHINYGISDDFVLETFQVNKLSMFRKENIYIRVHVYKDISFHEIEHQVAYQIAESYNTGKMHFTVQGFRNKNYILPIFIFENTDRKTIKYVVKQYNKQGKIRLLPTLYNGMENWWYHPRVKTPLILSILKILERS